MFHIFVLSERVALVVVFFFLFITISSSFSFVASLRVEPFERRYDVDSRKKRIYTYICDSNGNDLLVAAWVMNEEESKQSTTCGVRARNRALVSLNVSKLYAAARLQYNEIEVQ